MDRLLGPAASAGGIPDDERDTMSAGPLEREFRVRGHFGNALAEIP